MMKLHKLVLLFGAMTFAACDNGGDETDPKDSETGDTDSDADTDTDTDTDTDMMACYDDGAGGAPEWDLCEYDDDWKEAFTFDCANNSVLIGLRTNNWGFGPTIYIADTRFTVDYDEEHTLTETDTSPDTDGYSFFEVDLETDVAFASVDDGKSLFKCGDTGGAGVSLDPDNSAFGATFAVVVYTDATLATVADCIVFGNAPDELIDDDVVGGNGQAGAITIPGWLNSTNCRNAN